MALGDGTKCKTCFGCPRMVLCGPWKPFFFFKNIVWFGVTPPPGLVNYHTFYLIFFVKPSLTKCTMRLQKTACSCYSYSWYKSCGMLLRKNTKVFVGWFSCVKNTNAKDPTARYCYKSYASNANFGRTCVPVICLVFLSPFVGRFRVFYSLSLQRKVYRVGLGQGALEINVLSFADLK